MATGIMRPRSAVPVMAGVQLVDTHTQVGNSVLTPGFHQHLEQYYARASPEDQARCIELLTALDIAKTLGQQASTSQLPVGAPPQTQRPKTAMAALCNSAVPEPPADFYGPYTTTYRREYSGNPGNAAQANRPASTRAHHASFDLSGPIGTSSYSKDYYWRTARKVEPTRSGSSSKNRRNNPHPLAGFMNWRVPARTYPEQPYSEWAFVLTDDVMDRVCRGKLRSTYQSDYLAIQQGVPVGQTVKPELDVPLPPDWRSKVPYSLKSSMRHSYQKPTPQAELKGNTLRYGCNKLKSVPANGVMPTVSRRQLNLKSRTTYEREYVDTLKPAGIQDVRSFGRYYAGNPLASGFQRSDDEKSSTIMASPNVTSNNELSPHSIRSGARAAYPSTQTPSCM